MRTAEQEQRDTIVAAATPPGRAALAVVRVSGPQTALILRSVFERCTGGAVPVRRPVLGWFLDRAGERIDEGVVVLQRAPRSYTGEDLAELTLHGAPAIVREVVASCVARGARAAGPGEFTLRALLAGKIDLARAEAVQDLVDAATREQARIAVRQLAGEVGDAVVPLADAILDLLADVEAGLDFPEDEAELIEPLAKIAVRCEETAERIDAVLGASDAARRVRDGARVVLIGAPNAGKSSLFNALVGSERVIVTEEPGTTRDLVEELVVIEGLPVVLVDAAGVGDARGLAEREGMRRALDAAARANLVLFVYDLAGAREAPPSLHTPTLRVGTHLDLARDAEPLPGSVCVSSVTREGLDALRASIARRLEAPGDRPLESVALATDRHRAAAARAASSLRRAGGLADDGIGGEVVALELREAVRALREILGDVGPEDLLGRIFSRFCIGK